jgi:hypothetical protein
MKKKNYLETNFVSEQEHKSKSTFHKKRMPTIKCICGREILVIPDLKAMNRAIKNHVTEHKRADYGLVLDSLEEFLTEQILKMASEMNPPNAN